ncbi:MAG: hypothetical protein KatS3mg115_2264 [Candidatus Poribacteria bacterium]|nr:MAG: hypothetical protein KatS3mg115_2264 [Candidatus Poribacteria bacterium]
MAILAAGREAFNSSPSKLGRKGRFLESVEPIRASYRAGRLELRPALLASEDGELRWEGVAELPAEDPLEPRGIRTTFRASGEGLALGLLPLPLEPSLQGQLSLEAEIAGTLAQPQGAVSWTVQSLQVGRFRLDRWDGSLLVDASGVRIPGWQLESFGNRLWIEGTLPVQVGWGDDGFWRTTGQPLAITCDSPAFQLDFLSLLIPAVREASGTARIDLAVEGTLSRPLLRGEMALENGTIVLGYNDLRIEELGGVLVAQGDRMQLQALGFRIGEGRYDLGGTELRLNGLRPQSLRTVLVFQKAALEAWLPPAALEKTPFHARATGTASILWNLEQWLRRRRPAGGLSAVQGAPRTGSRRARLRSGPPIAQYRSPTTGCRNDRPLKLAIQNGQVRIDDVVFRHDRRDPDPSRRPGDRSSAELWPEARGLDLTLLGELGTAPIARWLNDQLRPRLGLNAPIRIRGVTRFQATVQGSLSQPVVRASVEAAQPIVNRVALREVRAELLYSGEARPAAQRPPRRRGKPAPLLLRTGAGAAGPDSRRLPAPG